MPEFPHLNHAPIVEALIFFQADVSASWKPEALRTELAPLWPDHTEVQELRMVKIEFRAGPAKQPQKEVAVPAVAGLMFRSKTKPTVYQARSDGFIASWLKPYPDWETFQADAVAYWERYAQAVGLPVLHSVMVKFINRVEFPQSGFSPKQYFTTHPPPPPKLGWQMANFVQQVEHIVPSTPYVVQTLLARAFDSAPGTLAFVLDIEVNLREPITPPESRLTNVLPEMRKLKNQAFFSILTPKAWKRYK